MPKQTEKTLMEKLKSLWSKELEENLDRTLRDTSFSFMEKIESDKFDEIKSRFNALFIAYTKAILEEDIKSLNYISKNFETASLMIDTENEKDVLKGKFQCLYELGELIKPNYFPTELTNILISNQKNIDIIVNLKKERMSYSAKIAEGLSISSQYCGDLLHDLEKNGFLYSKQVGKKRIYSLTGVGVSAARFFSKDAINSKSLSLLEIDTVFKTVCSGLNKFVSKRNPGRLDELELAILADESKSSSLSPYIKKIIDIIRELDTPQFIIEVGSSLAYTATFISKAGTIEEFQEIMNMLDSMHITDWLKNMGSLQQRIPLFLWYDDSFQEVKDLVIQKERVKVESDRKLHQFLANITEEDRTPSLPRRKNRKNLTYLPSNPLAIV